MSPRVGRWPYSTDHKDIGTLYFPLEKVSLNKGIAPSRFLHTNRTSQYLYLYNTPIDLSGVRAPTESDLKSYTLFLFRVFDGSSVSSSQPVVLDQGSIDKELSKGLLGWANKDPHRFAYGVQSELGENLLIVGDTTSTPSLVNGSSRTFKDISNDTFSSKYSLIPAAQSTNKVTYSNQSFPNKFIGDLGFDFEVEPYQPETNKSSFSGILLTAFQKLAIAGVVGSVTTFGVPDIAAAAGGYEEALARWRAEKTAWTAKMESLESSLKSLEGLPINQRTSQEAIAKHEDLVWERSNLERERPTTPNPKDFMDLEGKHSAPTSSELKRSQNSRFLEGKEDVKLTIPEGKESSPRELLRPQGDEKVEPNDSISVIPNEPDSPREPDPIVQMPDQGAGAGQQQGNNQNPGDLSEILGAHEAAEGAAARAEARVRAGISLWQYMMGHNTTEPTWVGYFLGDHPEINSWSQFFMGGGNSPSLGDYIMGSDNLSEAVKEKRVDYIWYGIYAATVAAVTYTAYYHGYNIVMEVYNWYHDLHPGVVVRRAGFLNHHELVDWLMERPYRDILKPHEQLWYDLFDPHHDVHLSNGWAGKAHMFEVLPTFGQAAELARFMPYALRSFLTTTFPVLAAVSKATNISPIKIAVVGAGVAAQAAVLAANTTRGQWLLNVATGITSYITTSVYQTTAWMAGLLTSGVTWIASKLVKVTAVTLDSAMDWGIRVAEGVGLLTPEQAERLRQARLNFNRVAGSRLREYWEYFKEVVGIAGTIGSNVGKGNNKTVVANTSKDEPFPWDALMLLSLVGFLAYLAYNKNKGRTRSINEETDKKDV